MKKIVMMILVLSLIMSSSVVFAGEVKVKVNNEDGSEEVDEKIDDEDEYHNHDWDWGFRGNGGPMIGVLELELSDLNTVLKGQSFGTFDDQNIIFFGGGGIGGSKKGSRFGGYGMSTKMTTTNSEKKAILNIDYGGFLYEKGIFVIKSTKTDLAFGLLMGGGNATLDLIYEDIPNDFDDAVGAGRMNRFEKDFVLLEPKINLHQQLGAFVGLDLSAGYLVTHDFGENWKIDEQVVGGPLENIKAPSYSARLSFGF